MQIVGYQRSVGTNATTNHERKRGFSIHHHTSHVGTPFFDTRRIILNFSLHGPNGDRTEIFMSLPGSTLYFSSLYKIITGSTYHIPSLEFPFTFISSVCSLPSLSKPVKGEMSSAVRYNVERLYASNRAPQ